MARMAAENIRAERESQIRSAIKAGRPIAEVAKDFDIEPEAVVKIMEAMSGGKEVKSDA